MVDLKNQKNGLWGTFLLREPGETAVLKGSWDGWSSHEMRRKKDGTFYLRKKIPAGDWQFGYEINGSLWVADDELPQTAGPFGSNNSLLRAGVER